MSNLEKDTLTKEEKERITKRFKKATYSTVVKALVVFGISAIVAAFIGDAIDNYFGINPYGKFGVLVIFYIGSWIYMFRFIRELHRLRKNDS